MGRLGEKFPPKGAWFGSRDPFKHLAMIRVYEATVRKYVK